MYPRKLAITDCEHVDFTQEKQVCAANNVEFIKLDIKTEEEAVAALQDYAVVGNQYLRMTDSLFDQLPNLKCVVRYGVGIDNVDIPSATRHGIAVCNVPDYSVQEVAAHAFAMMLALTRKLKRMDLSMQRGEWNYELSIPLQRYCEMTVGVIGLGRIGRAFAKMAHDLGCSIMAYDTLFPPTLSSKMREKYMIPDYVKLVSLDELLADSSVVSIHAPLSKNAGGCIAKEQLKRMRRDAYLINVSRGGLVKENDLNEALRDGVIAGAACDTWEMEPTPKDNPLLGLDNFIGTPHMAWYSEQASQDLKQKLAEECVRALNGEPLRYQLNREVKKID